MPYFLVQASYGSDIKSLIKNPVDRAKLARENLEKIGVKVHAYFYYLGGDYDTLAIIEVKDNASLYAFHLASKASGWVKMSKKVPLLSPEEGLRAMQEAGKMLDGFMKIVPSDAKQSP